MPGRRMTPLAKAVDNQLYLMGLSRYELADRLGISYQYLSNMLTGRALPTIQMSKELSKIVKLKDDEIRRLAVEQQKAAI